MTILAFYYPSKLKKLSVVGTKIPIQLHSDLTKHAINLSGTKLSPNIPQDRNPEAPRPWRWKQVVLVKVRFGLVSDRFKTGMKILDSVTIQSIKQIDWSDYKSWFKII